MTPGLDARYQCLTPTQVLINPAGTVVLKSSRFVRFWLVFGSVVLVLAAIVIPTTGEGLLRQVAGVLLFAAGVFLLVLQIVRPNSLTLRADGFSFITLGRRTQLAWSDVAEFGVLEILVQGGSSKQVGIRLQSQRSLTVRRLTSGMSGRYDAVLPEGYGLSIEDLTALMEAWRIART